MSGALNTSELLPALFRAVVILLFQYQIFIGVIKVKSNDFDFFINTLVFTIVYVLLTLLLPGKKIISILILVFDAALLTGIVLISGGGASWFAFALPYLVLLSVPRIGEAAAMALTVALTAFMFVMTVTAGISDIFRFVFWLTYFAAAYIIAIALFSQRQTSNKKYELLYQRIEKSNAELEKKLADMEQRLSTSTIFDPVTGLKNFRYIRVRVEEEISRARRQKYPFCICILGIDEFDKFEQRYGKMEKDKALVRVSSHLKKLVRDTDLIARYINDQFVMLFPQANPRQSLIPVIRIKKHLDMLSFGPDNNFKFTFSFGVAGFPDDVQEVGGLFSLASAALERSHERAPGAVTLASSLYMYKLQV